MHQCVRALGSLFFVDFAKNKLVRKYIQCDVAQIPADCY